MTMRSIRDNALSLAFGALFLVALAGQSVAGWFENNDRLQQHGMPAEAFGQFVTSSEFVVDVAENWQSEFLAVGAMIALSIFLRQRGSSESKPVGAPHHESAVSGE